MKKRKLFIITLSCACLLLILGGIYLIDQSRENLFSHDTPSKEKPSITDQEVTTDPKEDRQDDRKEEPSSLPQESSTANEIIPKEKSTPVTPKETEKEKPSLENKSDSKNQTITQEPIVTPPAEEKPEEILDPYTTDQYVYTNFDECFQASLDVALSDSVNIRNTSCEDIAVKDKIIGHRVIAFYTDGTWKYYPKATD